MICVKTFNNVNIETVNLKNWRNNENGNLKVSGVLQAPQKTSD